MTLNNVKIAITGGIGSGKSTVSDIVSELGYTVFSCDKIYSELLSNGVFNDKLLKQFGDIFLPDGSLDRKKLSSLVFNDCNAMKSLNEITHPLIMQTAFERMRGYGLSFCEVPLLFENGFERDFDGVIVVLRDLEQRISSVSVRDGVSAESVKNRIKSQYNYDKNGFTEYYVIHNDGNLGDLREKVINIVTNIKEKYLEKK